VIPFVDVAREHGKGIFILDKTSNPSSGELQDEKLDSGLMVSERMADLIAQWCEGSEGERGYDYNES
jgi:orotidine-5'-phosphate decarboxylase